MSTFSIDSKLTVSFRKNYPRDAKDLIKKLSFLVDKYTDFSDIQGTIFFMYVMTALHARHQDKSHPPVYIGEIKGVFLCEFIPRGIVLPISYHVNAGDSELNPDITIFFDLTISKSRRNGEAFEKIILHKNIGKVSVRRIRAILLSHYKTTTILDGEILRLGR